VNIVLEHHTQTKEQHCSNPQSSEPSSSRLMDDNYDGLWSLTNSFLGSFRVVSQLTSPSLQDFSPRDCSQFVPFFLLIYCVLPCLQRLLRRLQLTLISVTSALRHGNLLFQLSDGISSTLLERREDCLRFCNSLGLLCPVSPSIPLLRGDVTLVRRLHSPPASTHIRRYRRGLGRLL
jgi:hypothetical protein